eukprot:TRINITY_DN3634_c0_g2_i4.p1 TRINITY_DN3634_c0_g2~~TRINITY_DN3634_c0_g2_i4.p1  ORF type:complete len:190 (+),score=26.16 TRINITY_DN3634_c0_g2_i4:47-571(+)
MCIRDRAKVESKFLPPKLIKPSPSPARKVLANSLFIKPLNDNTFSRDGNCHPAEVAKQLCKPRVVVKTHVCGERKGVKVFSVRSRANYLDLQRSGFKYSNVEAGVDEFENVKCGLNLPKATCAIKTLTKSTGIIERKLIWPERIRPTKEGYLWKSSKRGIWKKKYCILKNKFFI